jgi:hypothetical protein
MATIEQVRSANRGWFSQGNMEFFGDIGYQVRHGEVSGDPYLVQHTFMWSDMGGGEKKACFRVHRLESDLGMGDLVDDIFPDLPALKTWLEKA